MHNNVVYFFAIYPIFITKSNVIGTHQNRLDGTILMSTNNIGFRAGIKKLRYQYPSLSRSNVSERDTSFSFNILDISCKQATPKLQVRGLIPKANFLMVLLNPYIVGTHCNRLDETIEMSTNSIGFSGE